MLNAQGNSGVLTEAEIMARLNLLPWAEQEARMRAQCNDGGRTGKTLRMIVNAIVAVGAGKSVQFIGHSRAHTLALTRQARHTAETCGVDAALVVDAATAERSAVKVWLFVDHFAHELECHRPVKALDRARAQGRL